MQSPNTAPLPCPTCRGPVGLAETNSINTFELEPRQLLPYKCFSFNIFSITANFVSLEVKKLINPGPAISIFRIFSGVL